MNNGEWGYDLYFDDPGFPRDLYSWLESTDGAESCRKFFGGVSGKTQCYGVRDSAVRRNRVLFAR